MNNNQIISRLIKGFKFRTSHTSILEEVLHLPAWSDTPGLSVAAIARRHLPKCGPPENIDWGFLLLLLIYWNTKI